MAILDELLVGLGFDYDPDDLEQFNSDLDETIGSIKAFAKVVIGGTVALVGFATATTAATDKQGKLSKQTGVSVSEIDALEFALKRAGGQGEAMGSGLEQLAVRISETARGMGSGVEAFGILGLSVSDANGKLKNTDTVLLEVADSLKGFSKAEQFELADKLGLRDSILLLQEGSEGIRKLTNDAKALGTTTEEDAKISEEFQDSLTDIMQIGKQFSRVLTRNLLPVMQETATTITDWWIANKDIIEQDISKFIDKAALAFKVLSLAATGFIGLKLVTTLISLINLFKALSIRALLANLAIGAIPALIFTIVTAIALLAEDAKTFFDGGESFIGSMIEKYPQWANEIRTVAAVFATLADLAMMVFDGWNKILDLFGSTSFVDDFLIALMQLEIDVNNFFSELTNDIKGLFTGVWDNVISEFTEQVVDPIKQKFEELKKLFSFTLSSENILGVGVVDDIGSEISNVANNALESVKGFFSLGNNNELPGEISIDVADLPKLDSIGADDLNLLNNLAVGNAGGGSTAIPLQTIPNDINTNNSNQTKIDLGGIKVAVNGVSGDPKSVGVLVGESIKRELEPILKQASIDLNNAVTI